MMACVVAWFCECGSIVRMSFCAAHFSVTALAGPPISARIAAKSRMFSSPLFERQGLFGERGEIARAQWNHLVVEIVVGIVQQAAAGGAALSEKDIGARPRLQEVGEVLVAHGRLVLGDHVF